ncbi:N-acetyltransferase [Sulfurospirillum sp. T05]|uniref:N-acetyltransferase n=1 Tax=Sulfurospirillum tamanense TaxID=2813362 RepID=A0ABS2WT93_9BACT|nr:N-acetyltransferase [Sulfurospirillum tamanensis]
MITYKKATLQDIAAMQALVKPEVDKGIILHRSSDEMATNIRSYMLAFEDEVLAGFGALHFHAPTLAEVRSLIVSDTLRGKGVGSHIVKALLAEAKTYGVKQVFTLTYQKAFFERLDFREIPKEDLPAHKIWADCIKCKYFPVCEEIALIYSL